MKRDSFMVSLYAFLIGVLLAFAVYQTLSGVAGLGALRYKMTHQCKGVTHD